MRTDYITTGLDKQVSELGQMYAKGIITMQELLVRLANLRKIAPEKEQKNVVATAK